MSTLTSSAIPGSHRGFGRLSEIVSQTFAAIREARRMMNKYEELTRMSDSELAHIGVRREDIPQVVASVR
ncbi:DUF1127 domain-containing protein [Azorhizobium doebereinerae]|uniref:DUF1127 domain-containing protein n=1 Tax=Azorhizobium doebereinerae TaxID=281091 RepID=UPI000402E3CD|nr:DUF1127 domain-containing protein [Azorhizobium doebereinerae]